MPATLFKWLRIAIINLCVIAFIGIVLRYKIAFSLPFINQKHLLHGHSHFAFTGWISQVLMTLLVAYLYNSGLTGSFKKYKLLLFSNLLTSYAMLITFALQGYAFLSIAFSTVSIIVSYFFSVIYWKDLNIIKSNAVSKLWLKASVLFNALSSLGIYCLAYLIAKHIDHQNWYLLSVYFFLHFQYNGWFFFACLGLFNYKIETHNIKDKRLKIIFLIFFFACLPTYFLSALWMPIPVWVYVLVVISALAQLIAGYLLFRIIQRYYNILKNGLNKVSQRLLILAGIALSIKLLLQTLSTLPKFSTLAFGFRPIVVGYLHLVLLGVITIFILAYMFANRLLIINRKSTIGVSIFVSGIIFNEILLMVQGIAGMNAISIPYTNELLLIAAIIIFIGMMWFVISQYKNKVHLVQPL